MFSFRRHVWLEIGVWRSDDGCLAGAWRAGGANLVIPWRLDGGWVASGWRLVGVRQAATSEGQRAVGLRMLELCKPLFLAWETITLTPRLHPVPFHI